MEVKENRPDACAASGTANLIYKDFSTDAPDIQGELTGPVLPDECAADIVSFCSEQTIAYDDLLEYATLFYLQDKDPEDPPFRDTLKFELLTLTNRCIDAYNFGKRDPNAAPGAKLKDAYPDKKEGAERYKRLSGLHTLQIAIILYKLHHAVGILWNNSHDDGNFDIGIYQYSGDNEGCYDVGEQNLKSLIRGYCKTGTIKDVNETIEALRAICPRVERCRNRDLVAVNNGIYDYGNKILMAFDPAFVFTSKKHVDFVDRARNPVIHNNEDGTDWDVVSWMNELSDDPDVVSLLWQIIGATVRPYVIWNKSAWLYSPSGNNGKGTLCTLLRNLCGPGDWTSIPLKNFGKDFMLTSLMHASVIITDENDTGTFVDDAASLKSIITGDPFQMNRKNRDPRDVLFNGFMVQCVNEIPRVRDKSESMLRRLLVIPFEKRFEGCERKYIKDDYLNRQDVLEYVLYRVLAENGYVDLAYNMVVRPDYPSYGNWIKRGATTLWEGFYPDGGRVLSLNHHFWGDISAWFYTYLAGIKINPTGRDVTNVDIAPLFPEKLNSVCAHYDTPNGKIAINWERTDENSFILKITAAEKLHGKILLPEGFTFEDGTHEAELKSGEFAIRKNT